jgi:hypothetical protein
MFQYTESYKKKEVLFSCQRGQFPVSTTNSGGRREERKKKIKGYILPFLCLIPENSRFPAASIYPITAQAIC